MKPIGVFDSGVGGLTVVAALQRRLPDESIIYLGDTARLPYGTKSPATVERYTRRNIDFLVERGVKAIVVACNTASALALGSIETPLPTWGVIDPGAAEAVRRTAGRIGIVATESTVNSGAYSAALLRLRPGLEVTAVACPLFVPLVEEGWLTDPVTVAVAERYLQPLVERRIDTLVLGCTHYPLLAPVLQRIVGPDVTLVDSAAAVAATVAEGLADLGLAAAPGPVEHHLCVTDAARHFARLAATILDPRGERPERAALELVDVPP